jgi:hypothetical protein
LYRLLLAAAAALTLTSLSAVPAAHAGPALATPTITVTADHTAISYDTQVVTLTGQVTVTEPDGTVQPYADQEVDLNSAGDSSPTAVTSDANGDFRGTVTITGPDGYDASASVPASSTMASGWSSWIFFTAQLNPVRITASVSPSAIMWGQQTTLRGTVTYQATGGSYVPLAGYTVFINSSSSTETTAVTDAAGQFSVPLTDVQDTGYTVSTAWSALLQNATEDVPVTLHISTWITRFTASVGQDGTASVQGCLQATAEGGYMTLNGTAHIQYATSPAGPWYTIGTAHPQGSTCPPDGTAFTGTAQARSSWAYYRVSFGGEYSFLPSVSSPVLAWKYLDRITGYHAARHGNHVTVSGRLEYYYSGWHPYGNQQMTVILEPAGYTKWYWIAKPRTNAGGWFSATITWPRGAHWAAVYPGNGSHFEAGTPQTWIGG